MDNKQFSFESSNCGCIDPQAQLGVALAKHKIRDFCDALEMGADATRRSDNHVSVFEKALSTYGCADFVKQCLNYGCDPNDVNPHLSNKPAISFAADSRDPQILAVLLRYTGVLVNRKYQELTPLNALAKNITAGNEQNVIECICRLLDYGASPNIPDQREMTPLHYVLKNKSMSGQKKRELVQKFIELPYIDVDTYRDGEARELLKDHYPDLESKLPALTGQQIDVHKLQKMLHDENETEFIQKFGECPLQESDKLKLLLVAVRQGTHRAFDEVLKSVENVNGTDGGCSAIEIACTWGNWRALEKLLARSDLKISEKDHPLTTVISHMNQPANANCDYRECFKLLIDSSHVDINEADAFGSTPLHYAVHYHNRDAIKALLSHGAYIGIKSAFSDMAIDGMPLEVLEEHFDNCITTNGRMVGDPKFEILINFKNFIPQQSSSEANVYNFQEEMKPIAFIADSKEHRHLLQHPLITSFLFLKWHRLSVIFYVNFLLYTFFAISIITHTVLKFRESEHEAATLLFGTFSWIGIIYLLVREILQFTISPLTYFLSFTNYMECGLIILSIMTCSEPTYDRETQRVIAVFTILLVAVELCLLVGSLPILSISTHMLMLRAVSKSFIKSFAFYSIFVVTFSLCFYILFGKQPAEGSDTGDAAADNEGGQFNKFANPLTAIIKTIVMLTGEFDAGDIDFNSFSSYMVFLLFVVFMSIVLFNLLNGLAVSDTQIIKAQAELNGSICRANLLTRYEKVLTGRSGHASFIFRHEPFRTICRRLLNLYPNYIAGREIAILPNSSNEVHIPKAIATKKTDFLQLKTGDGEWQMELLDPLMPCCCHCASGQCAQINSRTVKLAMEVIEKKANAQKNKKTQLENEHRLRNIENKLEKLYSLLENIQQVK